MKIWKYQFFEILGTLSEDAMEEEQISSSYSKSILDYAFKATSDILPSNYVEATETHPDRPKWIAATTKETDSLVKRDVFEVMLRSDLPANAKPLKSKWVFDIKVDGRYKARYTLKGCSQRFGIDYDETFSPVVRYSTLRLLCAKSAASDCHLHQMDVDTAFLYGRMDDSDPEVYCELPENYPMPPQFQHLDRKLLCARAKSAVYGLRQASRKFYFTLGDYLTTRLGFIQSASDPCLFYKEVNGKPIWVAVFVDDLIISSPDIDVINAFKRDMKSKFDMKDIGELRQILGMEVIRDWRKGTLTLLQTRYMQEMIAKFGMEAASDRRQHKLPLSPAKIDKLSLSQCPTTQEEREEADRYPYREVVGSLMYLMISTRPDIAFAVNQLSKYMQNWGLLHIKAAKNLLLYIKATTDKGITYRRGALNFQGFVDADWAGNIDNARSTTGYIFYLANGPISWRSKEQKTVALSTAEAEYMALSAATQEALHLRQILPFLQIDISSATVIYEDNDSALKLAQNPVHQERTRHINIRYHFIRENIVSKEIMVERVVSKQNLADLLTKAIDNSVYQHLIDMFLGTREYQHMV